MRILVVEDDRSMREVLTLLLKRNNYDVTDTVQVSDPVAVRNAVWELYSETYPGAPFDKLWLAFYDFERLFNGRYDLQTAPTRRWVSTHPPWSTATSTITALGFIAATRSSLTTTGARPPATSTAPITRSASIDSASSSACGPARRTISHAACAASTATWRWTIARWRTWWRCATRA